jgi:CubicO group peptidase (beta-lactamase class C family)
MKLLASLVLAALFLLEGFSFPQTGSLRSEPIEALASTLDDTLPAQVKESHIPGAVLVLVHDGRLVLSRAFGFAEPERQEPMRADTLLRVGSVSKPVTASAVLHLVQSGRIGLHQDLRPILADLPIEPPLSLPLTLHQLLTHTAGFSESLFGQHVSAAADVVDLGPT